jgi:hypothetical protein
MTATMAASQQGAMNSLKLLISKGANVNAVDREGSTPLMYAVRGDQIGAAKLLLSSGAHIGAKDRQGRTALHFAALRGSAAMTKFLIARGASGSAKDQFGDTPLHLCAKYSGDVATEMVLSKSSRMATKDKAGLTPADAAARYGNSSIAASFGRTCVTPKAVQQRTAEAAILPAVKRIQSGLSDFVGKAGCVSCHHQGLGVIALTQAAKHRYAVSQQVIGECFKQIQDDGMQGAAVTHAAVQDPKYTGMIPAVHLGDQVYGGTYILGALRSAGVPSNPGLGEGVTIMGRLQKPDGRFTSIQRGIMEHSDLLTTGLTLEVLNTYWPQNGADELKNISERARKWAMTTKANSAEDLAGRLLVLAQTGGATPGALGDLMSCQRPDGGWASDRRKVADAYTTGVCLYVARNYGKLASGDGRLKRAVSFLVRTQEDDGSWYEPKLVQAYNNHFDAAFPFGYDQYASFAGTCWATIGLLSMTP